MSNFTDEELLRIIKTGESDAVEFKESLSGSAPERIREAICAFANDLRDSGKAGVVIVGVKDDTTIGTTPIKDELLRRLADMKTDGNIVPPRFGVGIQIARRLLAEAEHPAPKFEIDSTHASATIYAR